MIKLLCNSEIAQYCASLRGYILEGVGEIVEVTPTKDRFGEPAWDMLIQLPDSTLIGRDGQWMVTVLPYRAYNAECVVVHALDGKFLNTIANFVRVELTMARGRRQE